MKHITYDSLEVCAYPDREALAAAALLEK